MHDFPVRYHFFNLVIQNEYVIAVSYRQYGVRNAQVGVLQNNDA